MDRKLGYEDFITAVAIDIQAFVKELHNKLMELGCQTEVKMAKSGYMVSYRFNKKTIANYVFRKKGLMIRIYASHINQYMEILDTLPDEMVHTIKKSQDCKRLFNPDSCNPRCSMGYDFWMKGEHYQKCRNHAFMFFICPQYNSFLQTLILKEVQACQE